MGEDTYFPFNPCDFWRESNLVSLFYSSDFIHGPLELHNLVFLLELKFTEKVLCFKICWQRQCFRIVFFP